MRKASGSRAASVVSTGAFLRNQNLFVLDLSTGTEHPLTTVEELGPYAVCIHLRDSVVLHRSEYRLEKVAARCGWSDPHMEAEIEGESFELFCTPAINLFPKRLDPISLLDRFSEFHAVPDRTRPADFEIYQIQEVIGSLSPLAMNTRCEIALSRCSSA